MWTFYYCESYLRLCDKKRKPLKLEGVFLVTWLSVLIYIANVEEVHVFQDVQISLI
jgi:hypothetical protein